MRTHVENRLLERALPVEADRAMELLRNKDTLARFHARCRERLGTDADRLAFPLAPLDEGPHLLVSRDAYGVTVLGRGMHVEAPRVPWTLVEQYLQEQADVLRRGVLARTQDLDAAETLAVRVARYPWRITRREFDALRVLAPLMRAELHGGLGKALMLLGDARKMGVLPDAAEETYRAFSFAGLMLMLLADDGDITPRALIAANLGDAHLSARGFWVTSNHPERLLAFIRESRDEPIIVDAALKPAWLAAIRHPSLEAELVDAVRPSPSSAIMRSVPVIRAALPELLWGELPDLLAGFISVEHRADFRRAAAHASFTEHLAALPPPVARVVQLLDPLRDLARVLPSVPRAPSSLGRSERIRNRMFRVGLRDLVEGHPARNAALTVLAASAPIEAYLPHDFPDPHWSLTRGAARMTTEFPLPAKPSPIRAEPRAGRNDPCPCGSGKKFKKCHGADA